MVIFIFGCQLYLSAETAAYTAYPDKKDISVASPQPVVQAVPPTVGGAISHGLTSSHPIGLSHHTTGLTGSHVLSVSSFTKEQVGCFAMLSNINYVRINHIFHSNFVFLN